MPSAAAAAGAMLRGDRKHFTGLPAGGPPSATLLVKSMTSPSVASQRSLDAASEVRKEEGREAAVAAAAAEKQELEAELAKAVDRAEKAKAAAMAAVGSL